MTHFTNAIYRSQTKSVTKVAPAVLIQPNEFNTAPVAESLGSVNKIDFEYLVQNFEQGIIIPHRLLMSSSRVTVARPSHLLFSYRIVLCDRFNVETASAGSPREQDFHGKERRFPAPAYPGVRTGSGQEREAAEVIREKDASSDTNRIRKTPDWCAWDHASPRVSIHRSCVR